MPPPVGRLSLPGSRRAAPPDDTHAEASWYLKQMAGKVPVVVVLSDGEELRGVIEWYDHACIKLTRIDQPNLLVFKHFIKYAYKDPANGRRR